MSPLDLTRLHQFITFNPEQPMPFPGLAFFFLFVFFIGLFTAMRAHRSAKVALGVLFSLFFYYLTSGHAVLVLAGSVLFNFAFSRLTAQADDSRSRKALLIASLAANIGILLYFKYSNFFIDQMNLLGRGDIAHIRTILPLGLSFYTFQAISCEIDIYRRKAEPLDNLVDFAFFLCFFPKLLAGPLTRLGGFGPQIMKENPVISKEDVDRGLVLIISGLLKKMLIADYIGLNFVDRVFSNPLQYSGIENLAAIYGYTLQIYCDFSGYTDIVLGIALFLGYRLPPNFNSPYLASDVREFWQRWHISLSLWFRDYLYIPLGGSRKGKARQCLNYIIVMGLCGFWHGASWTFVAWGLLHGLGLIACSFLNTKLEGSKRFIGILLTFHFVALAWVFFRAESFGGAFDVLSQAVSAFRMETLLDFVVSYRYIVILMAAGYILHFLPVTVKSVSMRVTSGLPLPLQSLLLAGTIWFIMQIKTSALMPFIYLQF